MSGKKMILFSERTGYAVLYDVIYQNFLFNF